MANILSTFQVPISNGLKLWCFEDWEEKGHWVTESISDEGVCRTAPATPGLLKRTVWLLSGENDNVQSNYSCYNSDRIFNPKSYSTNIYFVCSPILQPSARARQRSVKHLEYPVSICFSFQFSSCLSEHLLTRSLPYVKCLKEGPWVLLWSH